MKVAALVLIVLAVVATGYVAYTVSEHPHDFAENECYKCHLDVERRPKAMRTSITQMCSECHRKIARGKSTHPVDRFPETTHVPADLPLNNGKITCNTCHNIHEKRFNAFGGRTYFLRRPGGGREFCVACHDVKRSDGDHIEVVAAAHIGSKYTVTDEARPLDPLSVECIGCHDGSITKAIDFRYGRGVWNHANGAHPIGVSYRESRMSKGGLLPVSMIDKRVKLFGGKIGCGSCHDLYSKLPKKLCRSNDNDGLCLSCHQK